MKNEIPQKLINTICHYLLENYLPTKKKKQKRDYRFNDKDLLFFSKGVDRLSEAFTKERANLPKNYLNLPSYRAGYILYFLISNYLKSIYCLEQTFDKVNLPNKLNILDIGTGPGTSLIAAYDYFRNGVKELRLTGIDQNKKILRDAANILDRYSDGNLRLRLISKSISSKNISSYLKNMRYDIIFMSNFVGESVSEKEKLSIILELTNYLTPSGYLIIIEPALRLTTRKLMNLRDDLLLNNSDIYINAPCLHHEKCPMLESNRRDWCHMYLEWKRPDLIKKIDMAIGNRKDYLKFSYLILTKNEKKENRSHIWRVVSAPMKTKGKTELLLCNKRGLVRIYRLDRDKNKINSDFDNVKRGDIVEYHGSKRLDKNSEIKKIENLYSS